jgi:hypothetical protein
MAEKEVENINTSIYMNLEENEVEDDKDEVLFKNNLTYLITDLDNYSQRKIITQLFL